MGVLLYICCIFSEHLFNRTLLTTMHHGWISHSKRTFDEFFQGNNEICVNQRHLLALIWEGFKSFWKLYFQKLNVQYQKRSLNSLLFNTCFLWNWLPGSAKSSELIFKLKVEIKDLENSHCFCVLCQWNNTVNKNFYIYATPHKKSWIYDKVFLQ